jgi:hypothetical protein
MKMQAARNKKVRPTSSTNAEGIKIIATRYENEIGKHQYEIYLILLAVSIVNGFLVLML